MMKILIDNLNREVANLGVLYTKLHNFHWFVDGVKFFELHEKFEELYDEVTEHFDAVAERILMLDGTPFATLKEFLANATVKEAGAKLDGKQMVQELLKDFELLQKELTETIKVAQELEDEVTADLLIGMLASLQKHSWMFRTYLK
ncbi:MAG: Dps family protein [Bacilli bacterium]|nr:DNA starvation/stationary phase protection protein [Bacilli bacterium]